MPDSQTNSPFNFFGKKRGKMATLTTNLAKTAMSVFYQADDNKPKDSFFK